MIEAIEPNPKPWQNLKPWERRLAIASVVFFFISLGFYLSSISLQKWILGWEDPSGLRDQEVVGKIERLSGSSKRQSLNEGDFSELEKLNIAYNGDVITTGTDGNVRIYLDQEGTFFDLGPSSMVVLNIEAHDRIDGVFRKAKIKVIQGNVSAVQGPKPESAEFAEFAEFEGTITSVAPKVTAKLVGPEDGVVYPYLADAPLKWTVDPTPSPTILRLYQVLPTQKKPKLIVDQAIPPIATSAERAINVKSWLQSPGLYQWQVLSTDKTTHDRVLLTSTFQVDSEWEGITFDPALIGGKPVYTNQAYHGRPSSKFDVTLSWKAPEGIQPKFELKVWDKKGREIFSEKTESPKVTFGRGKVLADGVEFQVRAIEPFNGFRVRSKRTPLTFAFLPPVLVHPDEEKNYTSAILKEEKSFIFTWKKTDYTDLYLFELSDESSFENVLIKKEIDRNFHSILKLSPGVYYWRVSSLAGDTQSRPSKAHSFTVD